MSLETATEFVAVSNEIQDSAPEETVEETVDETSEEESEQEESTDEVEDTGEDSEETSEESDDHKKNANERIRELVDRSKKAEQELQDLKARFDAEQQQKQEAQKPYIDLDMGRLESDIEKMYEEVDDLKLEGKVLEAAKVQRKIVKLLDAVEKNEQVRQDWEKEQAEKNKVQDTAQKRMQEIGDAASFYQKHMNIPDDVWNQGGDWLKQEFEKNPVLGKKFADMVDRQGAVASIEWAHHYIVENMGKDAKEAKEKKEAAKKVNIGGSSPSGIAAKAPKSFDDMMKLSSSEIVALEKTNPKLFNKLVNDKLKRK